MIWAARGGHKDIVEYLVGQGADKDTKNNVSTYLVDAHQFVCMYVCMYLYVDAYEHVCVYLSVSDFIVVCVCTYVYVCICICMIMSKVELSRAFTPSRTYMLVCFLVCMYVCMYM